MSDTKILFLSGTVEWCKLLPKQLTKNNFDDYNEWTVDFFPDDPKEIEAEKLGDRLKDRKDKEGNNTGRRFLRLRQKELDAQGNKRDPIKIVGKDGKTLWDPDTEIGNGSKVDVRIAIRDYGKGKKKGIYLNALRVREHVSYERSLFPDAREEVEKPQTEDTFRKDFGLDDDINDVL